MNYEKISVVVLSAAEAVKQMASAFDTQETSVAIPIKPTSRWAKVQRSPDFRTVFLLGKRYTLTSAQAVIIRILYEHEELFPGTAISLQQIRKAVARTGRVVTNPLAVFKPEHRHIFQALVEKLGKDMFRLNLYS